jgi:predicted ArsR family transcriptional regulator
VPKPTFAERLEALASLREPIRRRLYQYVARALAPVSRDQAADAVHISRAMAAFHLDKLVELGLLRATYRRVSGRAGRGAGRPSKLYSRSRREFSVTLPRRDHELLARLLAETAAGAVVIAPDEDAQRFGRSLGARARTRVSSRATPQRLSRCVEDVLEALGFDPFPAVSGDVITRNCPFDPLSRRYPAVVCRSAIAIVRGVIEGVGTDALTVRRDERPDRCCVVLGRSPQSAAPACAPL